MAKFCYQPISTGSDVEIRLIHLLPGARSDQIRCELKHASLQDEFHYDAVSYCWGISTERISITCNEGYLNITQNLHSFLVQIRHATETRVLWADAICIDQANLDERSSQVQHMRIIYSKADRVIVWLGKACSDSDNAISYAAHIAQLDPTTTGPFQYSGDTPPIGDAIWGSLGRLFSRPYFQRSWIVQEIAMAKYVTVLCGSSSINWVELFKAASYFHLSGVSMLFKNTHLPCIQAIQLTRNERIKGSTIHPLCVLLREKFTLATDLRDYVFAFCGLAEPSFRKINLQPNYHLNVKEIYTRLAVAILINDQNLDLFTVPGAPAPRQEQVQDLPSWVPDWSQKTQATSLLRRESIDIPVWAQATRQTICSPQFSPDWQQLQLEGYIVDSVTLQTIVLAESEPLDVAGASFHRVLTLMARTAKLHHCFYSELERVIKARGGKKYVNGDDIMDVYWLTIRGGYFPEGFEETRAAFLLWYRELRRFWWMIYVDYFFPIYYVFLACEALLQAVRALLGLSVLRSTPKLDFPLYSLCNQRRIFRTREGYVGLGPVSSMVGDQIALCKGGRLPLVVRKAGDSWMLVGDCYISGMTKGALFDESKCKQMWFT
jgi:hypothetical protein